MNLTTFGILSGLLFGCIGMWMFGIAKKRANFTLIALSMSLMIYPYFTSTPLQDWGIGSLLCGVAYFFWEG